MSQIKIRIDREGNPTVTAQGFSGNDCLAATQPLEKLIGDPESRQRTGDAFAVDAGQQIETSQGG